MLSERFEAVTQISGGGGLESCSAEAFDTARKCGSPRVGPSCARGDCSMIFSEKPVSTPAKCVRPEAIWTEGRWCVFSGRPYRSAPDFPTGRQLLEWYRDLLLEKFTDLLGKVVPAPDLDEQVANDPAVKAAKQAYDAVYEGLRGSPQEALRRINRGALAKPANAPPFLGRVYACASLRRVVFAAALVAYMLTL